MEEIDPAFIQAVEHRPNITISEAEGIPVIDLARVSSLDHLHDHTDIDSIADLISKIGDACKEWGFFQVINHGVPMEKLDSIELAARKFFALPLEEKRKVRRDEVNPMGYNDSEHTKNVRDWKQVFDFTAKDPTFAPASPDDFRPQKLLNFWPQSPSEFREVTEDYAKEVEKLGFKLLELIALSLGLSANRFSDFFKDHLSFIRLNYYPPCPSPDLVLGVTRHKDADALTILAQDDVGGLQVKRKSDGEWVSVKPTPGAFIINIGDIIQVWSNDRYESVEHRVMVNSQKERISIPLFLNPSHHVMVKPLEDMIDEQNPAKYQEYNLGMFFATKRRSNLKKLPVENLQISHFKVDPAIRSLSSHSGQVKLDSIQNGVSSFKVSDRVRAGCVRVGSTSGLCSGPVGLSLG